MSHFCYCKKKILIRPCVFLAMPYQRDFGGEQSNNIKSESCAEKHREDYSKDNKEGWENNLVTMTQLVCMISFTKSRKEV